MRSIRPYIKTQPQPPHEQADALELPLKFPDRVRQLLGLDFRSHQWSDLVDAMRPAAKELEYESVWACMRAMLTEEISERQLEVLARHLTVIESYFFREKSVFDLLEQRLLPQLIERRLDADERRIRFWSAGCSTGEEVYSLAISLHRVLGSFKGWDINILGTDINSDALAVATVGEYRNWSFRDLSPDILKSYFMRHPIGTYQIEHHIREHVSFRRVNLAADWHTLVKPVLKDFDLILCRNVLIYMEESCIRSILGRFEAALRPDGVFIPSLTEARLVEKELFEQEKHGLLTVYRPRKIRPTIEAAAAPLQRETNVEAAVTEAPEVLPVEDLEHPDLPGAGPEARPEPQIIPPARALADAGDLESAYTAAKSAVDERPTDPNRRLLMAHILREQGDLTAAEREYQRCIYLDGECIPAHFGLGSLYRTKGNLGRSRLYFANALRLLQGEALDDIVPGCDVTGRKLSEIIRSMM